MFCRFVSWRQHQSHSGVFYHDEGVLRVCVRLHSRCIQRQKHGAVDELSAAVRQRKRAGIIGCVLCVAKTELIFDVIVLQSAGASNVGVTHGCISSCGGTGISAHGSSKVTAVRTHLRKNAGSGVEADSGSLAMLTSCVVSGNVAHGVSADAANIVLKGSIVIGNNICGCCFANDSTADAAETTVSGNRDDGLLHLGGSQCSVYVRVRCSGNNKSGLHLTQASLVSIKESAFAKNMRNGIRVEEGSTAMAERCRCARCLQRVYNVTVFLSASFSYNIRESTLVIDCNTFTVC